MTTTRDFKIVERFHEPTQAWNSLLRRLHLDGPKPKLNRLGKSISGIFLLQCVGDHAFLCPSSKNSYRSGERSVVGATLEKQLTCSRSATAITKRENNMRGNHLKMLVLSGIIIAISQLSTAWAQLTLLFNTNKVWAYYSNCLDTATDWMQPNYDDGDWPTGPGRFTGGETAAASLVGVTTTTLVPPATTGPNRVAGGAFYFRTHFSIASTNNVTLVTSNRVDD